jgi:hypothetical protein
MKSVLIIGSSHVGAIKCGIDSMQAIGGVQCRYLALPKKSFSGLKVKGGDVVFPPTLTKHIKDLFGFESSVCLDDFDRVLFVDGPSRLSIHLYSHDRRIPFLSAALVREIVTHIPAPLFQSLSVVLCPSRLIFLGAPLISSSAVKPNHLRRVPLINSELDASRASFLVNTIRNICSETLLDQSTPSILLPPPHLLTPDQFNTLDSFIRGGLRANGRQRGADDPDFETDMVHGNSLYGQEMGRLILDYVNQA